MRTFVLTGVALGALLVAGAPSLDRLAPTEPAKAGREFAVTAASPLPGAEASESRRVRSRESQDPIARLAARLASGEVQLEYVDWWGYLPSLLEALEIPLSSQMLVFSRTSLQTDRVAPWAPRALYYNDEVYIGWVQESPIIEIASVDPEEGAKFYTLAQTDPAEPHFTTETTTCLMCHESKSITEGVPGFMVRSILVDRMGYTIDEIHRGPTTDRTPFEMRWGGWYVTGTHEAERHSGNVYAPGMSHEVDLKRRYIDAFDFSAGANVVALEDRFDVEAYLTPHSDLVAIMVLAHQARVHNLIALVRGEAQAALRLQELTSPSSDEVDEYGLLPTTRMRISGPVERLVQTMLFVGAAPLGGTVRGSSSFSDDFQALGPKDSQGRSLRDFDLETRLFRYPLSFLIHSEALQALPDVPRQMFAERLVAVLASEGTPDGFEHLSREDREAILEILEATEPDLLAMGAVDS